MYELQRKQAQIQSYRHRIEALKNSSDRDKIRQLIYEMSSAGLVPSRAVSLMNLVIYFSPGTAINMLTRALDTTARRML